MSPRPNALKSSRESIAAAGHDLAMGLRAAYLTMHRRANAEVARLGLTADQFVILTALAEADGVTQKELARRTASDANTMSEMLGRLERRGLVARKRDVSDGRARRVSLTESGRELRQAAWDGVAAFCEMLAGLVPSADLAALVGHLERIARGMTTLDDDA